MSTLRDNLVVPKNQLLGITLMIIHAIAMSFMSVISKSLSVKLGPWQIGFLYKFSLLIVILPWCFKDGFVNAIKTKKLTLHIIRGVCSIIGHICFYYSLRLVYATDAVAILYLEQLIVLFMGVFYFKEKFTISKVFFVVMGLIGALCVIRPGFGEFNKGYAFLLIAMIFWASSNITVKLLGATERTKAQTFYTTLFGSLLSFPMALGADWGKFDIVCAKYIVALTIFHLVHTISFFRALRAADISTVMPFDYFRLVFCGLLSYLLLGEVPTRMSLCGYAIIAAGSACMLFGAKKKMRC